MTKLDVVGVSEIAEMVGTNRITVGSWHKRGQLPPPAVVLACGPIWQRTSIVRWMKGEGKTRIARFAA
jgi:predicted site-specific integrase-resolvase